MIPIKANAKNATFSSLSVSGLLGVMSDESVMWSIHTSPSPLFLLKYIENRCPNYANRVGFITFLYAFSYILLGWNFDKCANHLDYRHCLMLII